MRCQLPLPQGTKDTRTQSDPQPVLGHTDQTFCSWRRGAGPSPWGARRSEKLCLGLKESSRLDGAEEEAGPAEGTRTRRDTQGHGAQGPAQLWSCVCLYSPWFSQPPALRESSRSTEAD